MDRVVVDTNALILPFRFRFSMEEELNRLLPGCEVIVPSCVIDELQRLDIWEARAALKLARRYTVKESPPGDRGILELAIREGAHLFTADRGLRMRAKKAGVRVVVFRGKDHLVLG